MRKTGQRVDDVSFGLFIAAGIIGLIQLHFPVEFGDGYEMVAIARNLAAHGVFANPFQAASTGPTANNPPLYPLFLGILMLALKIPRAVMLAAAVASIVANALIAALLPRFSVLIYSRVEPGASASVLWLASMRLMPSWDVSFTVAALILFCLFSTPSMAGGVTSIRTGASSGILAGLLILLNPASLTIAGPWVVCRLAYRKLPMGTIVKYSCVLIATSTVTVFPWVLRNYRELGAPVIRTNLGMTLYASLNDCAEPSLLDSEWTDCYQSHHPNTSIREALLLRSVGEVAYDRRRIADAGEWIRTHPRRFAQLTLARFWEFWLPPLSDPHSSWVIWLITALSIPGLILMARRSEPATAFILLALLLYPLMYYLVVADVRYRYPVLWLSALPAEYLLSEIRCSVFRSLKWERYLSSHFSGSTAS